MNESVVKSKQKYRAVEFVAFSVDQATLLLISANYLINHYRL